MITSVCIDAPETLNFENSFELSQFFVVLIRKWTGLIDITATRDWWKLQASRAWSWSDQTWKKSDCLPASCCKGTGNTILNLQCWEHPERQVGPQKPCYNGCGCSERLVTCVPSPDAFEFRTRFTYYTFWSGWMVIAWVIVLQLLLNRWAVARYWHHDCSDDLGHWFICIGATGWEQRRPKLVILRSKAIHFNNKSNWELTHVERIVWDGPGH